MKITTVCVSNRENLNIYKEIIKSTMKFRTAPTLKYSVLNPGPMLIILILFSHSFSFCLLILRDLRLYFYIKTNLQLKLSELELKGV